MAKICPVVIIEDFEDVGKVYLLKIDDIKSFFDEPSGYDISRKLENILLAQTSFKEDFPYYFSRHGYRIEWDEDWCIEI